MFQQLASVILHGMRAIDDAARDVAGHPSHKTESAGEDGDIAVLQCGQSEFQQAKGKK